MYKQIDTERQEDAAEEKGRVTGLLSPGRLKVGPSSAVTEQRQAVVRVEAAGPATAPRVRRRIAISGAHGTHSRASQASICTDSIFWVNQLA